MNDQSLIELRMRMHARLKSWIPQNDSIVEKEMVLFDRLLSRRDFLKSTSFAAMIAVINQGCGSSNYDIPPSQWSEHSNEPSLVGIAEQTSVDTASNIHLHADLMNSVVTHKDLDVHTNTVLEGFNPTAMTKDYFSKPSGTGFKEYTRSYGHPEIIKLQQDSGNFTLSAYEECSNGEHGLQETTIAIGTDNNYATIYAANSSYHNKVFNSNIICQKMVALANETDSQNYAQSLMLYYQAYTSSLTKKVLSPQGVQNQLATLQTSLSNNSSTLTNAQDTLQNATTAKDNYYKDVQNYNNAQKQISELESQIDSIVQQISSVQKELNDAKANEHLWEPWEYAQAAQYQEQLNTLSANKEDITSQINQLAKLTLPDTTVLSNASEQMSSSQVTIDTVKPTIITLNDQITTLQAQYTEMSWKSIDVIQAFKDQYTAQFDYISLNGTDNSTINPNILEVRNYQDGAGNSFIYGTLSFGEFFIFGFIINYTSFNATEPTVSFFIPHEHAPNITAQNNFINNTYSRLNAIINNPATIAGFYIYAQQRYKPLSVIIDSDGNPTSKVVFSYANISSLSNVDALSPDVFSNQTFSAENSNVLYGFIVESSVTEISTPLENFGPEITISIEEQNDGIIPIPVIKLNYDTSNVFNNYTVDMTALYSSSKTTTGDLIDKTCTQHIFNDNSQMTIITAAGIKTQNDTNSPYRLGLAINQTKFVLNETNGTTQLQELTTKRSTSYFDSYTALKGKNYNHIWYDQLQSLMNNTPLADNDFDFYCTVNHQGLLRSYFLFKGSSDINNMLVAFNEFISNNSSGHSYLVSEVDWKSDTWYEDNSIPFIPPTPVAVGVQQMLPLFRVLHDGEILYTSLRQTTIDPKTRQMNYNNTSDSYESSNMSYYYSLCDPVEFNWIQHALNVKVDDDNEVYATQTSVQNHQVEMQLVNAYDIPVSPSDIEVEVRLSTQGYVSDMTDPTNTSTYKTNRVSGCFLTPSSKGHLSLEINLGQLEDKTTGANIMYRIVPKDAITYSTDAPQGTIDDTNPKLTGFKTCNLSYQVHGRQTTENFNSPQPLAPEGADSPGSTLDTHNGSNVSSDDNVKQVQSGYDKIYAKGKVDNDSQFPKLQGNGDSTDETTALRATSGYMVNPFTFTLMSVQIDNHGLRTIQLRCCSFISDVASAVGSAVHNAVNTVKKAADAVVNTVGSAIKSVASTIVSDLSDLAQEIGNDVMDAIHTIGSVLDAIVQGVISYVKLCINALAALLDFETAAKVGTEFKKIIEYHTNPKPENGTDNLFSMFEAVEDSLTNIVNKSLDSVKEEVISYLSPSSGKVNSSKVDSTHSQTSEKNKNTDTTKTHYMTNQIDRGSAKSQSTSSITAQSIGTTTSSRSINDDNLSDLMSSFEATAEKTIGNGLDNSLNDLENMFKALFSGSPMSTVLQDAEDTLKDFIVMIIDLIEELLDTAVHVPTAALGSVYDVLSGNDADMQIMDSEVGWINDIIRWLSLDSIQLTGFIDLFLFIVGFVAYVVMVFIDQFVDIIETIVGVSGGQELDMIKIIKDGTFVSTVTSQSASMTTRSFLDNPSLYESQDWLNTKAVSGAIYYVLDMIQAIVDIETSSTKKANLPTNVKNFFEGLKTFCYVGRSFCKVQEVVESRYGMVNGDDFVTIMFNDIPAFGNQLYLWLSFAKGWMKIKGTDKTKVTDVSSDGVNPLVDDEGNAKSKKVASSKYAILDVSYTVIYFFTKFLSLGKIISDAENTKNLPEATKWAFIAVDGVYYVISLVKACLKFMIIMNKSTINNSPSDSEKFAAAEINVAKYTLYASVIELIKVMISEFEAAYSVATINNAVKSKKMLELTKSTSKAFPRNHA